MHIKTKIPLKIYFYLLKEAGAPFLGGMVFFVFIFLMFQIVRLAEFFISHGVGLLVLGKLTVYISAAFMPVILPVSFLIAVLVAFGRLSADSEVVAMKASGISIVQMYFPIALFSFVVALMIFYLTNFFIPWGNYQFKRTLVRIGATKVVSNIKEGTFTEGFFDLLVYVNKTESSSNRLSGVFIYDERDRKNPYVIMSKSGVVIPVKTEEEFGGANILKLYDGAIYRVNLEEESYEKIDFKEYKTLLKIEEAATNDITYPKTLSSPRLWHKMQELKGQKEGLEYVIEYWKRVSLSLTPLIFGALGIGLGIVKNRSVKSYAFLVAVVVVVVYWALHVFGQSLSEKEILNPAFSMQLPNLVLLPFAFWSLKKSAW
jgi:lipopolysaccharide export system permease protein